LALLGIPANRHPAAIFSEKEPRPGEMVFAFGHPWGQRNVLTGGVLSAVIAARTRRGEIPVLRTDARLAPGNSGGPLLSAAGEVIGLNAMIFGGDQGIAIPASVICEFLDAARKTMPADAVPEGVL
jgi:serine protease Do